MNAITQTIRGAYASLAWLSGAPFVTRQMARADHKDQARDFLRDHCARFQRHCGFDIRLDGPPPPPGRGCVIVYNEASFIDSISYAVTMWPHVDRAAIADIYAVVPYARKAMERAQIEMVPRGDRAGTERVMAQVVEAVQNGERLAWGGEGRIHGQDGIGRFKVGSALIAIRAQVPLVPVVFHGGHQIMPLRSIRARPATMRIRFGDPISTKGISEEGARELVDHLQGVSSRIYAELKAEDHARR